MRLVFSLFFLVATQGILLANSDLYTRVLNFDGLPLRLSDGREFIIGDDQVNEYGSIDMADYFVDMAVDVPEGGMIVYSVKSGRLIARLTKEGHELLDTTLVFLYRHENHVAITRAYLALLGPLPDEERVSKVLDTGFMPDPLISSLISRIREIEQPLVEADLTKKLFPDWKLFSKHGRTFSDGRRAEIKKRVISMKLDLAKLLRISIERLKKELEIIEVSQTAEKIK